MHSSTAIMNYKKYTIFIALMIMSFANKSSSLPSFYDKQPTSIRGFVNFKLIIPCSVRNMGPTDKVGWRKSGSDARLSLGSTKYTTDSRITVRFSDHHQSWDLIIDPARKSDEGTYVCDIKTAGGVPLLKKTRVTLTNESLAYVSPYNRYDLDEHRCGNEFSVCDPLGVFPCCSPYGYCGYSPQHCDCARCVDFRLSNDEPLSPRIDPRTPTTVRGVLGELVELPCTVLNSDNNLQVQWSNEEDEVLATGSTIYSPDRRLSIRISHIEATVYLQINPVQLTDAGFYNCEIINLPDDSEVSSDTQTRVTLSLLNSTEGISWSVTGRCGGSRYINGALAECDPFGAYPCCSEWEWCGFTADHCDCLRCIDYRLRYPTTAASATTGDRP